ncbi:hypothetical protein F5050DRAFT_1904363 [Lentinula boryana]|uniref:Protein kinase domain-containing protein n=1 Tax=Lentinula boryana TaxID=40481 RepID=A0ABQ8Q6D2_9AGAR|nr:hypothetical protein F5050DRAFT_1904363 [Lentinula boryana]
MIFRDIFLQLVLGACLCIQVAANTPHDRSKIVTLRRSPSEDRNPESLARNRAPCVDTDEDDEEWFKELEVPWINYDRKDRWTSCVGYGDPVFSAKNLTSKLTERVRFSLKGNHNKGIYTLRSEYKVSGANARTYPKETVIVKFIDKANEPRAACEVRALERFGFFIEAGRVTTEKDEYAVIVKVKQSGAPLRFIDVWINAPVAQKRAVVQDMKNRVHDEMYRWVTKLQLIHVDFSYNNVLGKIVEDKTTNDIRLEHIEIVDYGHPGIWPTKSKVIDKEIFTTWFEARWNFLWKDLIEKDLIEKDPIEKDPIEKELDNEEKGKEKRMQKRRLSLNQLAA